MLLRQEILLCLDNALQLIRFCNDGPNFIAFDVANQVREDLIALLRATEERQVFEIKRSQIQLDDRSGVCPGCNGRCASQRYQ